MGTGEIININQLIKQRDAAVRVVEAARDSPHLHAHGASKCPICRALAVYDATAR
jgi:hypothetical protein